MPINDILQVTIKQRWIPTGEPMYYNLWFNQIGILGGAEDLANGITEPGGILETINSLQVSKCENDTIKVINLFSPTDFFEEDLTGAGAYTSSQSLPIHSAVNFTKKTDNREINNGTFRISGIPEEVQADGVITESGYIGFLNDLRALLAADVNTLSDNGFDPIVVKRIEYDVPGSSPVRKAYKLPASAGAAELAHVVSVIVNTRISHQVSRGNGR